MPIIGGIQKGTRDYERVKVDEWIPGIIEEVQLDPARKSSWQGQERIRPELRFKFRLEGYQYPHYSRWMYASTGEKSNFYLKYLRYLCPKVACINAEVELAKFHGVMVKTMWEETIKPDGNVFQHIAQIRGLDSTLDVRINSDVEEPTTDEETENQPLDVA